MGEELAQGRTSVMGRWGGAQNRASGSHTVPSYRVLLSTRVGILSGMNDNPRPLRPRPPLAHLDVGVGHLLGSVGTLAGRGHHRRHLPAVS